jgi:hypothetical protein
MKHLFALMLGGVTLSADPAFAQTASIAGTVTDAITLAPIGDTTILVTAYNSAGQPVLRTALDAAGHYELKPLNPGAYFVRVWNTAPTYVPQQHANIPCVAADCAVTSGVPVAVGSSGTVTVDFALARAGGVTGTVRRSSNSSPVDRVGVHLYNSSTSPVASTRTGSSGTYAFSGLAAGTYLVRTAKELDFGLDVIPELYDGIRCPSQFPVSDCRIASGTPILVAAGATTSGIDFSLDPAATISGTVMAAGSTQPLANVPVNAFMGAVLVAGGFTNASGQYMIGGLAPGAYRVTAAAVAGQGNSITVPVGDGENVGGVNFSLAIGEGMTGGISGRLTVQCSGPLGGILPLPIVEAYSSSGVAVGAATYNPDPVPFGSCPSGSYAFAGLAPGQYYLRARDVPSDPFNPFFASTGDLIDELYNDIVCVTSDCDVTRGTPVIVTAGSVTPGVDFDLAWGKSFSVPGPGASSGSQAPSFSVFDERGVPLVNVVRRNLFISPEIVGLPPGTYFVKMDGILYEGIACPDCPPTSGTPIVIRPETPPFALSFTGPDSRRVSGTVRDTLNAPLSTITVELYTDAGRLVGTAVTDLLGNYSIASVFPGTHFLRTRNDRGYVDAIFTNTTCASCDVRTGTPVVVAAADVTGIDFTLALGGVLSGQVIDTSGLVVGGVPVSVFNPAGVLAEKTVASVSGQFRVTLPAGSYRARADVSATHGAEIFSELPCTSTSCDVTAGTAIAVTTGTITPNINFTLASCSALTLSPGSLASAVAGTTYRQVFSISGGTSPPAFQIAGGALPLGVTLSSSTGVLAGTPAVSGRHEFTVGVTDATGCATAQTYTLDVQECAFTLSPASATLPAAGGDVLVTIANGCGSQMVTGTTTWAHLQSNTPGQVSFTVDPNTDAAPRSASLTIGRRVFELRQAGVGSQPPFGALDVPGDGSQVSGAVAVGGWALDDLEVARVLVYREAESPEVPGLVFLGDAVFVPGARPDVAQAFPGLPFHDRAGFGFMILTNMLPNQGNGGVRIHVVARDVEGRETLLGSRSIFGRNASATQPFGTIDRPAQGETIAGQSYLNWGWALTPQPAMIPIDGSTIQVIVDGASVGNVTYNLFRPDVSGAFPGLENSAGPIGYRSIDTTALAEGLHTIAWFVTDSLGATSGLGSRYFTVANAADAQPPAGQSSATATERASVEDVVSHEAAAAPVGVPAAPLRRRQATSLDTAPLSDADVTVQRGVGVRRRLRASDAGEREVTIAPTERLELALRTASNECEGTWAGYLVRGGVLGDLPVGASLDPAGTFYWQPGPGFAGRFPLLFVRTDCQGIEQRLPVLVTIQTRVR